MQRSKAARPGALAENIQYISGDSVYYAGSSRKLKGTERKVTLLIGSEPVSLDYGITESEYLKCLYVALSRAIDSLVVFISKDTKIAANSPLGVVIKHANEDYRFRIRDVVCPKLLTHVRVRDDLSSNRLLFPIKPTTATLISTPTSTITNINSNSKTNVNKTVDSLSRPCPKLGLTQLKHNEDFMGLFVEALLALRMEDPHTRPVTGPWRRILEQDPLTQRFPNIERVGNGVGSIATTNNCVVKVNFLKVISSPIQSDRYILTILPNQPLQPPQFLMDIFNRTSSHSSCSSSVVVDGVETLFGLAYCLTVLNFTSRIGKWWVASQGVWEHVKQSFDGNIQQENKNENKNEHKNEDKNDINALKECMTMLPTTLGLEGSRLCSWGKPYILSIPYIRKESIGQPADLECAQIVGVLDLEFEDCIVEVKFAHHSPHHLTQTRIYVEMVGKPGLLVNLLEGQAHDLKLDSNTYFYNNEKTLSAQCIIAPEISDITSNLTITYPYRPKLNAVARTWLALKNGYSCKRFPKRLRLPSIAGALIVVVDVETIGYPPHGLLIETAMAAFYAGTTDIEAIFSSTIDSAVEDLEQFSGLSLSNYKNYYQNDIQHFEIKQEQKQEQEQEQENLRKEARQWLQQLRGRKIGISWGSCDDATAAGVKFDTVINLQQLYIRFLRINGITRHGGGRLSDALEHLFPENFIHPHRALEDVIGTIAVFAAIINFSGVV